MFESSSTFDILNWVQHEYNGTQLHRDILALYDSQLCYNGGGTEEENGRSHRAIKQVMIKRIAEAA